MASKQRMEQERRIALEALPTRPERPTPVSALRGGPSEPNRTEFNDDFKED